MADYSFEVLAPSLEVVEKGFGAELLPQSVNASAIDLGGTFFAVTESLNMTADTAGSGSSGGCIVQRTIPALARVSP